jgi:hypothetical protein
VCDRLGHLARAERELAEPLLDVRAVGRPNRLLERLAVQLLGALDVVEAQGELGFEEQEALRPEVGAGREVVLRDAQAASELPKELERRDAVAGLDARDVGRGATGERELALAEAGCLARRPKALADCLRVVYVG